MALYITWHCTCASSYTSCQGCRVTHFLMTCLCSCCNIFETNSHLTSIDTGKVVCLILASWLYWVQGISCPHNCTCVLSDSVLCQRMRQPGWMLTMTLPMMLITGAMVTVMQGLPLYLSCDMRPWQIRCTTTVITGIYMLAHHHCLQTCCRCCQHHLLVLPLPPSTSPAQQGGNQEVGHECEAPHRKEKKRKEKKRKEKKRLRLSASI